MFCDTNLVHSRACVGKLDQTASTNCTCSPSRCADEHIRLLFDMQDAIDALVANPGGSSQESSSNDGSGGGGGGGSWNVTLADVCLKPMGADCATQSVLQYWGMSREAFEHGGWVGCGWLAWRAAGSQCCSCRDTLVFHSRSFLLCLRACSCLPPMPAGCPAGPPGVGVRVTPEFCFTHWSTQVGDMANLAALPSTGVAGCVTVQVHQSRLSQLCVPPTEPRAQPPFPAPAPQCRAAFGGPVDPHLVLGGFPTDSSAFRNFSSDASAFVVTYPIDSHPENRWVVHQCSECA